MSEELNNAAPQDDEESFDLSPEEATSLDSSKPGVLNRRRILIAISVFFAVLVCGGVIFNSLKSGAKKKTQSEEELQASRSSSDFINSLQSRAARNRENEKDGSQAANQNHSFNPESDKSQNGIAEKEPLLPPAYISSSTRQTDLSKPQTPQQQPQTQYPASPKQSGGESPQYSGGGERQQPSHFKSQMVPQVEGRLFAQQPQFQQPSANQQVPTRSPAEEYFAAAAGRNSANAYAPSSDYDAQNAQQNKQDFLNAQNGESPGFFIGANSVWQGTIIPAILENAINTDLPGDILARVSQNVFDSQTGKNLLIPQGTLLIARYNSSVSYAQHRVQIVWDSLIRPDGFQITLGSNSADKSGMSGQAAKYSENWFEYLKAAGIITLFSIANAKMTETAAEVATPESSGNIAAANSSFVNQTGDNLISRAMNIQPTLTVDNGTQVNVMLNKNLYLPPVRSFPPVQKYILE